jgi:biopolymer transport protein ExbD
MFLLYDGSTEKQSRTPLTADKIYKKVKYRLIRNKNLEVYIRADKKVSYGAVIDMMSLVKKAGVKKVGLITKTTGRGAIK